MAQRTANAPGIAVAGSRILLRPMTGDDLAAVEPWYPEAAGATMGLPASDALGSQSLCYEREAARADPNAGRLVMTLTLRSPSVGEGSPIGLLDYRPAHPAPGWLSVAFIAVARPLRGRGYGSEAVRLLEGEAVRRWGAVRFRAEVDVRNGLGLYFWLRLGYRPGEPAAGAQGRNVLPMLRDTA